MSWKHKGKDTEYVKLFRKMANWEWYTDPYTCHLFMHCLIRANWKDGTWRGIPYKRGQFISTIPSLADETGLSIQNVRTALEHLKLTGELTDKQHGKKRVITVVNYDMYQGSQQDKQQDSNREINNILTDSQQDANNSIRIYKNNKEDEESIYKASPEDDMDDEEDPYADIDESEWMEPDTLPRTYGRYGGINV